MYVCLCTGVTDGQIREAIYEGCCSYKEVRETTGVASQCGKCACLAKEVVRETLTKLQSAQAAIPFPAEPPGAMMLVLFISVNPLIPVNAFEPVLVLSTPLLLV